MLKLNTIPLITGDKKFITEEIVLYIPFTLNNFSSGTIWGIIVFTVGVCTPVPMNELLILQTIDYNFFLLEKMRLLKEM